MIATLSTHTDKTSLSKEEVKWIAHYRKLGARLTNLTDGGEGAAGRVLSAKSIEKMSNSHKGQPGYWTGKKRNPATCRKISESNLGKKAWNKGIPLTDECKQKLSIAMQGRTVSESTRKKLSEAHKGKPRPKHVCEKISKALKGRKGRKQSDAVRKKISKSMSQYRAKIAQSDKV